jgi:hypothetical protein
VVDRALIYIVEISNVKQPTAHADVSRFTRACEASAQRHFPAVAHFLLANARAAVLDAGLVGDDVSDTCREWFVSERVVRRFFKIDSS